MTYNTNTFGAAGGTSTGSGVTAGNTLTMTTTGVAGSGTLIIKVALAAGTTVTAASHSVHGALTVASASPVGGLYFTQGYVFASGSLSAGTITITLSASNVVAAATWSYYVYTNSTQIQWTSAQKLASTDVVHPIVYNVPAGTLMSNHIAAAQTTQSATAITAGTPSVPSTNTLRASFATTHPTLTNVFVGTWDAPAQSTTDPGWTESNTLTGFWGQSVDSLWWPIYFYRSGNQVVDQSGISPSIAVTAPTLFTEQLGTTTATAVSPTTASDGLTLSKFAVSSTAPSFGTSSALTWTLPAATQQDDLLIAFYGGKDFSTTVTSGTITTDYTLQASGANGTTNAGNGTGSMYAAVYTKVHDGAEANPAGTLSAVPNVAATAMISIRSATNPGATWTVQGTFGSDNTSANTDYSATGASTLPFRTGDYVVAQYVHNDDSSSSSAFAISVPGCTVGPATQVLTGTLTSALGGDMRMYVVTAPITSGTATGAPTVTATTGTGDADGSSTILLVRPPESTANLTISPSTSASSTKTVPARTVGAVTRTNLWTNPRFQTATTGLSMYDSGTITWDNTVTRSGTGGSAKVTIGASPGSLVGTFLTASGLTVDQWYCASVWCRLGTGASVDVAAYAASSGYGTGTGTLVGTTWARTYVYFKASATSELVYFLETSTPTTGDSFYIDDLLIERVDASDVGTVPDPYFDGVTDNNSYTNKISQSWTGTADASTSTITYAENGYAGAYVQPTANLNATKFLTGISVIVNPTTAAAGTTTKPQSTSNVLVSPETNANPSGIFREISGSPKTFGTLNGGLGLGIIEHIGIATATAVSPTTTSTLGAVTKPATGTSTLVDDTTTATLGAVTKSSAATAVTVSPIVTATAAGTAKSSAATNVTVSPTVTAVAQGTVKPATATSVTVSPTSAATAGAVTKPGSATSSTSPTTVSAGVVNDSGLASVSTTPTVAAAGFVTDATTANNVTVSPIPASAATKLVTESAVNVTVTPTTTSVPQPIVDTTSAIAVTVAPTSTASGTASKSTTSNLTASPIPASAAFITDTEPAGPVTVSPIPTATAGGTTKPGTTSVTTSPTTASAGVVADFGVATSSTSPTPSASGTATKSSAATGVTVSPTVVSAGVVNDEGTGSTSISPSVSATSGAVLKSSAATQVTQTPTTDADGVSDKDQTANNTQVTPTVTAAGFVRDTGTVSVAVTRTVAASGLRTVSGNAVLSSMATLTADPGLHPFFRSSNENDSGSSAGTVATVTIPADVQDGDMALVYLSKGNQTAYDTTPTGYTLLGTQNAGTEHQTSVWYKVLTTADASTVAQASWSTSSLWSMGVVVYGSVDSIIDGWSSISGGPGVSLTWDFTPSTHPETTAVLISGTRRVNAGGPYTHAFSEA